MSLVKSKAGSFVEAKYVKRTDKNTYMSYDEREELRRTLQYELNNRSPCAMLLEEIMLKTRATGQCIEAFFQQFGTKMKHGLTELTMQQFKKALHKLGVPWADDESQIEMLFKLLDHDQELELRGTLGLDELAVGVIDCV